MHNLSLLEPSAALSIKLPPISLPNQLKSKIILEQILPNL
ncbi:hypothetical protein [Phage Phass-1]|uniref:Uncharacterized protein n=1 Tax=Phage Phass-1 TaxID=3043662 RepID=A0AAF0LZI4_9CAUD|nr:hypothetical protein [Phage Phass-1]